MPGPTLFTLFLFAVQLTCSAFHSNIFKHQVKRVIQPNPYLITLCLGPVPLCFVPFHCPPFPSEVTQGSPFHKTFAERWRNKPPTGKPAGHRCSLRAPGPALYFSLFSFNKNVCCCRWTRDRRSKCLGGLPVGESTNPVARTSLVAVRLPNRLWQ